MQIKFYFLMFPFLFAHVFLIKYNGKCVYIRLDTMNKRELFIPGFLILLGWGLFIITAEDEKVSSKDDHPARTPNQLHEEENVPREPMFPTEPIEENQDTETYGQQIIFNTVTPKGIPMNITVRDGIALNGVIY